MWTFRVILACGLVPALLQPSAHAQAPSTASSMVVDVPQDNLYHHPACSLVRAAGSKVRVMRQGEATSRGMKPHDCAIGDGGAALNPNAATVYVQKGDSRYHKEGCAKLTAGAAKTTLGEAGKDHWPCAVCKPPRRKPVVGDQK
jgi:hypothetical protein